MKMEVYHSTKVTHNFTASKKHLGGFFEALSRMCEDQTYTDLHLVAGDGQIFAAHQVYLTRIRIQFDTDNTTLCLFCEGYAFTLFTCRGYWFVVYICWNMANCIYLQTCSKY